MKKNSFCLHYLWLFIVLVNSGCQSGEQSSEAPASLGYFTAMTPGDTLNFFLDSAPMPAVQEVPVAVLYSDFDSVLFFQMGYMQDTAAMKALAHGLFPLDAEHDAALLELQEGWFAFKYLLLFDKAANRYTQVTPVCEFYGGDGGQIRSESWLFLGYPPQLLTRFSERYLRMGTPEDPDEVQELFHETVQLKEWRGMDWQEAPVQDSIQWINDFPVKW